MRAIRTVLAFLGFVAPSVALAWTAPGPVGNGAVSTATVGRSTTFAAGFPGPAIGGAVLLDRTGLPVPVGTGQVSVRHAGALTTYGVQVPSTMTATTNAARLARAFARATTLGLVIEGATALMELAKVRYENGQWTDTQLDGNSPTGGWKAGVNPICYRSAMEACQATYSGVNRIEPINNIAVYCQQQIIVGNLVNNAILGAAAFSDPCEGQQGNQQNVLTEQQVAEKIAQALSNPAVMAELARRLWDALPASSVNVELNEQPRLTTTAATRTAPNGRTVRFTNNPDGTVTATETDEPVGPDTNQADPGQSLQPGGGNQAGNIITCGLPGTPPCKVDETGTPEKGDFGKQAEDWAKERVDKLAEVTSNQGKDTSWGIFPALPSGSCQPIVWSMLNVTVDPCLVVPLMTDVMTFLWAVTTLFAAAYMVRGAITRGA